MRHIAPLLLPAALAAAGCLLVACSGPEPPPPAAATATPADAGAATDDQASTDNTGVTMRYRCDAGTGVTVFTDGTARVSLPGGQVVAISRVAGSAPPVFSGNSIYFTVGEQGARLSQDDQANELACTAS